jgi:hypothetical protein
MIACLFCFLISPACLLCLPFSLHWGVMRWGFYVNTFILEGRLLFMDKSLQAEIKVFTQKPSGLQYSEVTNSGAIS